MRGDISVKLISYSVSGPIDLIAHDPVKGFEPGLNIYLIHLGDELVIFSRLEVKGDQLTYHSRGKHF